MATNSEDKQINRNYFIVAFLVAIVISLIIGRACYTIFVEGPNIKIPTPTTVSIPPARGNIYDTNDELIATSEYRYRFYMDFWADGLKGDTLKKYVGALSRELNRLIPEKSAAQYESCIMSGWRRREAEEKTINDAREKAKEEHKKFDIKKYTRSRDYLLSAIRYVNYSEYKAIKQMPFFKLGTNKTGLKTRDVVIRTKPYGILASRTIGDIYGDTVRGARSGLELQYDSLLRGIPGISTRQKVEGRLVNIITKSPVAGQDLVSTIDITMQDIVEKALYDKVSSLDAESGTAVVMEVKTGHIKAIANLGRKGDGRWEENGNYAVSDLSEPGSTFKVASMMVALDDGLVHPQDSVNVGNGVFHYKGESIIDHNANRGGYGAITAEKSIWFSSNVGVSKLILKAYENDPGRFVDGLYKIGLNKDFHLEIPGYAVARIRHPKTAGATWYKTTLAWMSFGYETRIPPIYTLTFYNAIANDGKMVKPMFVKEIRENGSIREKRKTETLNSEICSAQTLQYIRSMLDSVVNYPSGTGKPARSSIVRIAGKTGTAQLSSGGTGYSGHQVSFCGYFPADKPQYSCIVVIRRPRNGAPSGGLMCGTVFKQIAEEIYAENMLAKPIEMPENQKTAMIPEIKNGLYTHLKTAMKKLNVEYVNHSDGKWVKTASGTEEVAVSDLPVSEKTVPDVSGMGAKDAIFAMESSGLNVRISGRGKVVSQSISAGSAAKGQSVLLVLR
ncbi:MAG: transpeptidase family protein [Dysgonamonadaceae bacterium]|jgi:cell division protein FtsI (penicillin-binding protein 3)|nr:transpeptidase family protein [Dysgonamonadaceae bacterium]